MGALRVAFSCRTFRVLESTRPGVLVEMPLSASRGRPAGRALSILQLLGVELGFREHEPRRGHVKVTNQPQPQTLHTALAQSKQIKYF